MLVGAGLIDKNHRNIDWIDMNPHQLELFYHVAKFKGVSRAARQMPYGIQQPSVSAQVNALERDLGVTLYELPGFPPVKLGLLHRGESTAGSKIRRAFLEEVKRQASRFQGA